MASIASSLAGSHQATHFCGLQVVRSHRRSTRAFVAPCKREVASSLAPIIDFFHSLILSANLLVSFYWRCGGVGSTNFHFLSSVYACARSSHSSFRYSVQCTVKLHNRTPVQNPSWSTNCNTEPSYLLLHTQTLYQLATSISNNKKQTKPGCGAKMS